MGGCALLLIWLIFIVNRPPTLQGFSATIDASTYVTGDWLNRTLKNTMLLLGGFLILQRVYLAGLILQINSALGLLVGYALASTLWSIAPDQTLLRLISLAAILMACLSASMVAWHPRRFQDVLLLPFIVIIFGSLILGIVAPQYAIEAHSEFALKNSWYGLTHGKNELGMISGTCVLIFLHSVFTRKKRRLLAAFLCLGAFTTLILSRSNSSLFALVFSLTCAFILLTRSSHLIWIRRNLISVAVSLIALYEATILNFIPGLGFLLSPITYLTGKDSTFSARTTIWSIIEEHIKLSPLIGSGYGAYWIGPVPDSPSRIFLTKMYFYPTEAHNGYLEIVNDLGILGFSFFVFFIFRYFQQAQLLMRIDRSQGALFIALLLQQLVANLSESDWLSRSNTFAILVLASLCMARGLVENRSLRLPAKESL